MFPELMRRLRRKLNFKSTLICIWATVLFFCEWLLFPLSVSLCSYSLNPQERMIVIADPQLSDAYSYNTAEGFKLSVVKYYCDIYLKRAFRAILSSSIPFETILYLGDLFDGGREWIGPLSYHYEDELERFRTIFNVHRQRPHVRQLFMAGNHDIGFGTGLVVPAYNRFVRDFGNTSYIISTGNHDVIVLDTIALSTFDGPIKDRALEVFKQAVKLAEMNVRPRILFTHVPLYRPFGEPCGRNRRARNMINQARGYQYQNLVDEHLTQFILDDIRPTMIFSGDDHDQCLFYHTLSDGGSIVPEYTVGTFSWMQGNFNPSFGILEFTPSGPVFEICFLPSQLFIFILYTVLLVFTLLALVIRVWRYHSFYHTVGSKIDDDMDMLDSESGQMSSALQTKIWMRVRKAVSVMFDVFVIELFLYISIHLLQR